MTYWLNKTSRKFLDGDYLKPGETAESRIREVAEIAQDYNKIEGFADRVEYHILAGNFSLSTPIWTNFGPKRKTLPISCNGSNIMDTMPDIIFKTAEIGQMTGKGAGTSAFIGNIRQSGSVISSGGKTLGPMHYVPMIATSTNIISQSNVRRGKCAIYMNIEHGDIEEFLKIGSPMHEIQNLLTGVTITDKWMEELEAGNKRNRKLWADIIKMRFEKGYPYIVFTDNVARGRPAIYKELMMDVVHSNLCTEIFLPDNEDESFVCCLLSMNLENYDNWKDTDAVQVATYLLDTVMEEYIIMTENDILMKNAHNFAKRHRAIGVGVMGYHSYLQDHMIPFESLEAKRFNIEAHKLIRNETQKASRELAKLFGEPLYLEGKGLRFTTTMATAPTTSSAQILGQTSPSREPIFRNYYIDDLAKIKTTYKNPHLKKYLASIGKDTKDVWEKILIEGGSVQNLDFLDDHAKNVFKTFEEISQYEVILQASQAQDFIDQGQSLNLMIPQTASPKEVSKLYIEGWKLGIKSFYYQRTSNVSQEKVRQLLDCISCEA